MPNVQIVKTQHERLGRPQDIEEEEVDILKPNPSSNGCSESFVLYHDLRKPPRMPLVFSPSRPLPQQTLNLATSQASSATTPTSERTTSLRRIPTPSLPATATSPLGFFYEMKIVQDLEYEYAVSRTRYMRSCSERTYTVTL
jgi:hypothetical protein